MPLRPSDMREDVESWDVRVQRQWPYFRIGGQPFPDAVPPVVVLVSVSFTNDLSATEFEGQVRELLQPRDTAPFNDYHHRHHTPADPDPACANCREAFGA